MNPGEYTEKFAPAFPIVQRGAPLKRGLSKQEILAAEALSGILANPAILHEFRFGKIEDRDALIEDIGRLAVLSAHSTIRALNSVK